MNGRPWTEDETAVLRADYGRLTAAELAGALGRTRSAVRTKVQDLRLLVRPAWSAEEDEVLYLHYGRLPAAQLAGRLGCTVSALQQRARKLRLARTYFRADGRFRARLRELVPTGLCNRHLAAVLGTNHHTIKDWRRQLGLPASGGLVTCATCQERARRQMAEQHRAAGQSHPAVARARRERASARRYALRHGWPDDLPRCCVDILRALNKHGPLTGRRLVEVLGRLWRGNLSDSLKSNLPGGSFLAYLVQRGLVVSLGRIVYGGGFGRNVCLYSLALDARSDTDGEKDA